MDAKRRIHNLEKLIMEGGTIPAREKIQYINIADNLPDKIKYIETEREARLERMRLTYGEFPNGDIVWYIVSDVKKPANTGR